MWMAIVVNLVIAAISYALAPKQKNQTPTAGTLDIPSPKLGTPIPVIFGEVWIKDAQISYYGNSRTAAIKAEGGK